MNTENITNRIINEKYYSLLKEKGNISFWIYAKEKGFYSDLNFIKCFKDRHSCLFWWNVVYYSEIPMSVLFDNFKEQLMKDEVFKHISYQYYKNKGLIKYYLHDFNKRYVSVGERYLNEYTKYNTENYVL